MTVIVARKVYVDPEERDRFLEGVDELVRAGRRAPGCLDLSIPPDPAEAARVNIFEFWESQETLDA